MLREAYRPIADVERNLKFERGDLVEASEEFFSKYGRDFIVVTRKLRKDEVDRIRQIKTQDKKATETTNKEEGGKCDKVIAPDKNNNALTTKAMFQPTTEKKAKKKSKKKAKKKSKKKKG